MKAWNMLKIGCVPYLNALPLCRYLPYPVTFATPVELEHQMNLGNLDIALLPIFSFFKQPSYIPFFEGGIIGSDGPVESVCVFSDKISCDSPKLNSIKFTSDSKTSVSLFKVIYSLCWNQDLSLINTTSLNPEAFLEIGDKALFFDKPNTTTYDLGKIWKDWTGLPFVYAGWVARENLSDDIKQNFIHAKKEGLRNIPEIVASLKDLPKARLLNYLTHSIRYDMKPVFWKGIELFQKYCVKIGL